MIDLRVDFPIKEEITEQINTIHAQIRDLLLEEEQLMKILTSGRFFYTRDEIVEKLRLNSVSQIPKKIPKVRVGNKYIIEKTDLDNFINSNKK